MVYRRIAFAIVASLAVLSASPAQAFNPHAVLSDYALTAQASMSLADVQEFLQERGSLLATTFLPDSEGNLKFPSEILWFAAQEARVNSRVLLAMLQKEQSLVETKRPTQSQFDWAMGYGCPDGSGCNGRFKGFGKQVRGAALQLRGYLDDLATKGETIAKWAVGRTKKTSDGYDVTPRNAATAALYSYTPWRGDPERVGGNYSFARIWSRWFGGGRYPEGAVLRGPDGTYWRIQDNKRRPFASLAALRSRVSDAKAIPVTASDLEAYDAAGPIRFANYTVVEDAGVRWLLVDDTRRRIASAEVFRQLGFHPDEVERATVADLEAYREGAEIAKASEDPRGTLVYDIGAKKEYVLIGNTKHPILHESLRRAVFGDRTVAPKQSAQLAAYAVGDPIRFPDGELVTSPKYLPRAFVISQGKRRPFTSPRTIEELGYHWTNLVVTSNVALELHPEGEEVTGGFVSDEAAVATIPAQPTTVAPSPARLDQTHAYTHGLSLY